MGNLIRLLLAPAGGGATALLTAGTLLIAVHQNQLAAIAGYGAGLSVGALFATIAGGGTTLVYLKGEIQDQNAVRQVRVKILAPGVLIAACGATAVYGLTSELRPQDVFIGAIIALLNNLAEIEAAHLKRTLKTPTLSMVDIGGKIVGLILVLIGMSFPIALLIGALTRQGLLQWFTRKDPSRRGALKNPLRPALRLAYERRMLALTMSYIVIDRLGVMIVPFVTDAWNAGIFTTLVSLTQAFSGLIVSGLNTALAVRRSGRASQKTLRVFETLMVGLAFAVPVILIVATGTMLQIIGIEPTTQAKFLYWALVVAVPIGVINRLFHFRAIAANESNLSVRMGTIAALTLSASQIIALGSHSLWLLGVSPLVGESTGLAVGILSLLARRIRNREGII